MTSQSARFWIDHLDLELHSEGGFYKQMYSSDQSSTTWDNRTRPYYTIVR